MPDLNFQIESAAVVTHAALPLLAFKLQISNTPELLRIHTVVLHTQIQIDVTRRQYSPQEQAALADLFGDPSRWGQTLRNMLWTHVDKIVPGFEQNTLVDLPVPCTFDFNVAATKYFHGLKNGDLPLIFLFSGTVFYQDESRCLQVAPVSWDKEAEFRLPVQTWRRLMENYYPNSSWLCLRKDVFERLYQYKVLWGIPTWEQTVERVLSAVEETAQP